jgi:hypothetical protein
MQEKNTSQFKIFFYSVWFWIFKVTTKCSVLGFEIRLLIFKNIRKK